jgi:DNA-binding NarL/FixJ family response regulator
MTLMPTAPIRLLVVDDHPLMREGILGLVSGQADFEVVGEAADGHAAVTQFLALRPDITLMDLQMPDGSGQDAIVAIRREAPDARIVVLTTYAADALAQRALKAGAQAYLLKSVVRRELADILRGVHRGQRYISPEAATRLARAEADEPLSGREVAVLMQVAHGHSNKVIGHELSITEETVKSHVKNILAKLGARDRTHAVRLAIDRGLLLLEGSSS